MNLFTCRPKYLAGLYILLVDDLTIPAHTKSTLYVQSFCDEQRFTIFRYRNYKYYLAKPLYLLFLGRDWFFDAIG